MLPYKIKVLQIKTTIEINSEICLSYFLIYPASKYKYTNNVIPYPPAVPKLSLFQMHGTTVITTVKIPINILYCFSVIFLITILMYGEHIYNKKYIVMNQYTFLDIGKIQLSTSETCMVPLPVN